MARFQLSHSVNTQNFDKLAVLHHSDPITQVPDHA
jgi:hypothetical protein